MVSSKEIDGLLLRLYELTGGYPFADKHLGAIRGPLSMMQATAAAEHLQAKGLAQFIPTMPEGGLIRITPPGAERARLLLLPFWRRWAADPETRKTTKTTVISSLISSVISSLVAAGVAWLVASGQGGKASKPPDPAPVVQPAPKPEVEMPPANDD